MPRIPILPRNGLKVDRSRLPKRRGGAPSDSGITRQAGGEEGVTAREGLCMRSSAAQVGSDESRGRRGRSARCVIVVSSCYMTTWPLALSTRPACGPMQYVNGGWRVLTMVVGWGGWLCGTAYLAVLAFLVMVLGGLEGSQMIVRGSDGSRVLIAGPRRRRGRCVASGKFVRLPGRAWCGNG